MKVTTKDAVEFYNKLFAASSRECSSQSLTQYVEVLLQQFLDEASKREVPHDPDSSSEFKWLKLSDTMAVYASSSLDFLALFTSGSGAALTISGSKLTFTGHDNIAAALDHFRIPHPPGFDEAKEKNS